MSAPPDPAAAAASQPLSLDPNPPLLPLPSHFHPQSILGRPPNPYAVGRGYPPRPSPVSRGYPGPHMVTVANPAGYIRNNTPTAVVPFPSNSAHVRSAGIQMYHHHQRLQKQHHHHHQSRPPFIARSRSAPEFAPTPIPSLAPKVSPFPVETSKPEPRDASIDDGTILLYDRKVRLSDSPSGSLYGLCRSWLRNGMPHEVQHIKFGDGVQLLPKPLPRRAVASTALGSDPHDVEEGKESQEAIDQISASDLLQRHVKRAKRVRACLNEERLGRIERYKQRLALLLPVPLESERYHGS